LSLRKVYPNSFGELMTAGGNASEPGDEQVVPPGDGLPAQR